MGQILKPASPCVIIACCVIMVCSSLFFGCGETECSESTTTALYANFYQKSDNASHADTLFVYGLGNDSLLYDSVRTATLTLPLRLKENTTAYVFKFITRSATEVVNDTVTFIHQNNEHFISASCGCAMFYTIDTVIYTRRHIDSIAVNNKAIVNEPRENIRIFF
ncbi:MAG: DUF6452 family protein [Candidatus Azobacteroides sp.]|nr:DUF6452 family protein [Candidatus Azobacteroides sp.]